MLGIVAVDDGALRTRCVEVLRSYDLEKIVVGPFTSIGTLEPPKAKSAFAFLQSSAAAETVLAAVLQLKVVLYGLCSGAILLNGKHLERDLPGFGYGLASSRFRFDHRTVPPPSSLEVGELVEDLIEFENNPSGRAGWGSDATPGILEKIRALRERAAAEPADSRIHSELGRFLKDWGDLNAALRHLSIAASLDPSNSRAHSRLGDIWFAKRQYGKAADAFDLSLRAFPNDFGLLVNAGRSFDRDGQTRKATERLQQYLSAAGASGTEDAAMGLYLADLLVREGRSHEARIQYTRLLTTEFGMGRPIAEPKLRDLAGGRESSRDERDPMTRPYSQEQAITRAGPTWIALFVDDSELRCWISHTLANEGYSPTFWGRSEAVWSIGTPGPGSGYIVFQTKRGPEDAQNMLLYLKEALRSVYADVILLGGQRLYDARPEFGFNLPDLCFNFRSYRGCRRDRDSLLRWIPGVHGRSFATPRKLPEEVQSMGGSDPLLTAQASPGPVCLGMAQLARGEIDLARQTLKQEVNEHHGDTSASCAYGHALYEWGDYDGALAQLTESVKLDETNAQAASLLGKIYYDKLDFERAIEHYRRALKHAAVRYGQHYKNLVFWLGNALINAGRPGEVEEMVGDAARSLEDPDVTGMLRVASMEEAMIRNRRAKTEREGCDD